MNVNENEECSCEAEGEKVRKKNLGPRGANDGRRHSWGTRAPIFDITSQPTNNSTIKFTRLSNSQHLLLLLSPSPFMANANSPHPPLSFKKQFSPANAEFPFYMNADPVRQFPQF
jgi:hypothetical protein